jgi:hypothetical protein
VPRPTFSEREPYEQGFARIFDREIATRLGELEAERLRLKKVRAIRLTLAVIAGVAILAAALVLGTDSENEGGKFILWVGIVAAILVPIFIAGSPGAQYRDKLREVVMGPTTRFLAVTYARKATPGFDLKPFAKRGVVGSYNSATVQDLVTGEHKGRRYEMVDALLRRRSGKSTSTVFKGVLLSISWPEAGSAEVLIGRDYGKILNKLAGLGKAHRVNFYDPEFERRYECYAKDLDDARRLLTPIFLHSWLAVGDGREGERPTAAFTEGRFLLALPLAGVELFEPGSLSRSVDSFEADMHTLLRQLTIPRRVIEVLQNSARHEIL